ncbi:MAG: prepilin peptidase, partial [Candidatus Saccharimonadales bacterium]
KPKSQQPKKVDLSIMHGRSVCPSCQHQLATLDLVPVLSWLALRGRCRYCRQPISSQYPLVELVTVLLFVGSYLWWPLGFGAIGVFQLVVWLIMLVGFMALIIYDLRWMLLPSRLVWPLAALALLQTIVLTIHYNNLSYLLAGFWGLLCLAGLFFALFQFPKRQLIGGGDVRLAVVLGLLVGGPLRAILLLFLSSIIGTIFSLPLLASGRKALTRKVPFGPFLIIATIIVYLFGAGLIGWYKRQFLLL